ncbi:hypothetical protein [Frankia sp. QA3]|uniref:hypothetical protein n=1 Tax=Frankia sp. QA3 TaxID=710111 RepID=UPI000269C029|nr:hypothetical protein [Frankia sp. QA3]EIV91561.1 hypothetical protein FraQA3DRAFT_1021 [Frankia sp. QA3]
MAGVVQGTRTRTDLGPLPPPEPELGTGPQLGTGAGSGLGADVERQRARLLAVHAHLAREREAALSPAIERALETAQMYLFLALGYVGHTDALFPDELQGAPTASPSTDPTEAEGVEP